MEEAAVAINETPKPFLSIDDVRTLLMRLFGVKASTIYEFDSYDDRTYHVTTNHGQGIGDNTEFILNVLNSGFTAEGAVEAQTAILDFLQSDFPELRSQAPVPNLKGKLVSYEKICNEFRNGSEVRGETAVSALRLFIYLPGSTLLSSAPLPLPFFKKIGTHLGDLQIALQKYPREIDVKPLEQRAATGIWCLANILDLRAYLHVVKDAKALTIVNEVITEFEEKVLPVVGEFRKGVIHQDFSDCNVLAVQKDLNTNKKDFEISGVIDFDDMMFSCLEFDVATAMMYLMFCSDEPLEATANLLAGFESRAPLPEKERGVLRVLIAGRFIQSLVLGLYFGGLNPDNSYISHKQERGWTLLELFWNHPQDELMKLWNGGAD